MSSNSNIEWTDATWNPVVGCTIVSPGCTNCYAMKMAARIEKMATSPMAKYVKVQTHYTGTTQKSKAGAVWTGKVARAPDSIFLAPLGWRKPQRIFVNSMGDLFHESIPDRDIDAAFAVMALCPQHTFQVLTKRADRMREYLSEPLRHNSIELAAEAIQRGPEWVGGKHIFRPLPFHNVWLGISAERQQEADERIPLLLQTPAAVRFISAEPLLGAIDLQRLTRKDERGMAQVNALGGEVRYPGCGSISSKTFRGCKVLDWIIVGGESGPDARVFDVAWADLLIQQCRAAGVACFVKQLGANPISDGYPYPLKSKKGGDWTEWPDRLRIREFPVTDSSVSQRGLSSADSKQKEETRT